MTTEKRPPADTSTTARADGDPDKAAAPGKAPAPKAVSGDVPMEAPTANTPKVLAQYETMSTSELRAAAKKAGVEINPDVEKALLVKALRDNWYDANPPTTRDTEVPQYDLMSLDDLRSEARTQKVGLSEDDEHAQLQTELQAWQAGNPASAEPGKGAQHVAGK